MAGSSRSVAFYYGLGSRYSYLAATQLNQLTKDTGAEFEWRPLTSSALKVSNENPPFIWDSNTQDWSGAKVSGQYREAYRQTDLSRWAKFYGVPYQNPLPPVMDASRRTFYCVAAAMKDRGQMFSELMFKAMYVDGLVVDEPMCHSFAEQVDLDPHRVQALIDDGSVEFTHNAWVDEARALGVFGVPSFVLNGDVYWGNDHLPLLAAALR